MFDNFNSNKKAISFLKNELKFKKDSGTYLFYGVDQELLKLFAESFAKSLNCDTHLDDFCDKCEYCLKIENNSFGDLEILEDVDGIKIDQIRDIIYKNSTSSYEGKNKIYILHGIEKLRKETANALLKLIEEPNYRSFFILTASTLNILPTIKSRAILLHIIPETSKELGVSDDEFNFFLGKSNEIKMYKNIDNIKLSDITSYTEIGVNIKKFIETNEFKYKIEIYKCIRDFLNLKDYLTNLDIFYFIDEIIFNVNDKSKNFSSRHFIREILSYSLSTLNSNKNNKLEKLLEIKNISKASVNLKTLLISFYSNI